MSKLLLLVQSERDVAHLDAAARAILNTSITGVWVVFSPSIAVNPDDAAKTLDAEIAQLDKAETDAANRKDYEAAAGYKTQREGRVLDRAKEIRDAHKKLTSEEMKQRTGVLFGPLVSHLKPAGLNVKLTLHSDHYDREQWVAMLNSLSGVWFKEFTPGSFVVAWPESVETAITDTPSTVRKLPEGFRAEDLAKESPEQKTFREKTQAALPKTRREELEALHPMKLGPIMRELGLAQEGLSRSAKIEAILTTEKTIAETPKVGAPVLAETAPETVDAY